MFSPGNAGDCSGIVIGEPTTTTLLNQHNSQLHSKYIFLHLQINVDVTPHQRHFFFLQKNKDNYGKIQLYTMQCLAKHYEFSHN